MTQLAPVHSNDISTPWLADVLREIGYSVEFDPLPLDASITVITAKHSERATLGVSLRPKASLIGVSAMFWLNNPPTGDQVAIFNEAVWNANSLSFLLSVTDPARGKNLSLKSFFWICETITPFDFQSYISTFNAVVYQVLEESGLVNYG